MTTPEVIAIASALSVIFLVVFKFLLSKVQNEFESFKQDLKDFEQKISDKINKLDKAVAVKSSVLEFMKLEIDELKRKVNQCKQCKEPKE